MPCLVWPLQCIAGCNGGVWTLSAVLPPSPDEPVCAWLPQYLAGEEVSGEIVCKFWHCGRPIWVRMTADGGMTPAEGEDGVNYIIHDRHNKNSAYHLSVHSFILVSRG